jgi:hypothetical protein
MTGGNGNRDRSVTGVTTPPYDGRGRENGKVHARTRMHGRCTSDTRRSVSRSGKHATPAIARSGLSGEPRQSALTTMFNVIGQEEEEICMLMEKTTRCGRNTTSRYRSTFERSKMCQTDERRSSAILHCRFRPSDVDDARTAQTVGML